MKPEFSDLLAGLAMVILGMLAGAMMVWPIPAANATSLTFVLGALSGALTVGGGQKAVNALKASASTAGGTTLTASTGTEQPTPQQSGPLP